MFPHFIKEHSKKIIFSGFVLLLFFVFFSVVGKAPPPKTSSLMNVSPMKEDVFWQIIGFTQPVEDVKEQQAAALELILSRLPANDILAFDMTLHILQNKARDWNIWAVAFISMGGCSDDCFSYFQSWLVSRGQKTYLQTLHNPDNLADILAKKDRKQLGILEFGQFAYVPHQVWQQKTGQPPSSSNNSYFQALRSKAKFSGMTGTAFKENPDYLASHFPKTWKLFGENPLPDYKNVSLTPK